MNTKTKRITTAAMLAALQLVLLYLGTVMPSWKLAVTALAGIINAAVLIECGVASSILSFVAVSVLGAVILPQKSIALMYIVFFGYYPLMKSAAEHVSSRVLEWLVKLVVFNFACIICWTALRYGFITDIALPDIALALWWIGLNVVFVLYDIGLSRLINLYIQRIHKNLK